MTHLTALRNSVLCGVAIVAVAGCGATRLAGSTNTGGTSAAVSSGTLPTASATPDDSAVNQQVQSIDNQLGTIDGQINAANAGLSTSEGDPSQ
jgi:hypothetical protein